MIIGITGVFGTGKTTIARLIAEKGYFHINADEVGHKLLKKNPIKDRLLSHFGCAILTNGRIDRKKLKKIVFYDKNELKELNNIIHPEIIKEIKTLIKNSKNKDIVVDGALLIEAKALDMLDKLIVVRIDEEEQLKRLLNKNKYTEEEIKNIINSQMPQKEKLKYADIVIDNSGSLDSVKKQLEKIK